MQRSGRTVLFWDCSPCEASRLARMLRADLAGRDAEDFRELSVCVEWMRVRRQDYVVCLEGHALTPDARRTGTTYEATVVERPPKPDFVPEVKKALPGQPARRLTGLPRYAGSRKQAGQQLSVWMRHLTECGDYRG